jgi:acyl-CoA synthetase (AMP-forming)/AMP-acid ligase II
VVTGRDAGVDLIRSSLTNAKSVHQVHTADRAERRRGRRRLSHAEPGDVEGRTGVDRLARLIVEFQNALLTAFVVLRSQADVLGAEDLIDWSRRRMAGFTVPRSVQFLDELPTNATGKVVKDRLR